MQLVAPVRVVVVLEHESLRDGGGEGYLAAILAEGAAQGPHGVVVLAPRHVVPPLDGDSREMDIASGYRMRPGFGGKVADGCLQHSAQGESSGANPRWRIGIAPTRRRSNWGLLESSHFLERLGEGTVTSSIKWPKPVECASSAEKIDHCKTMRYLDLKASGDRDRCEEPE